LPNRRVSIPTSIDASYTLGMAFEPRLSHCNSQAILGKGRPPATCLTAKRLLNPSSLLLHLNSRDEVLLGPHVDSFRHVALG
jgi:hypothetical protein